MPTLEIVLNGTTVFSGPVSKKSQIWAAMKQWQPTSARGCVVVLKDRTQVQVVAMSRHSTNGPIWGLA